MIVDTTGDTRSSSRHNQKRENKRGTQRTKEGRKEGKESSNNNDDNYNEVCSHHHHHYYTLQQQKQVTLRPCPGRSGRVSILTPPRRRTSVGVPHSSIGQDVISTIVILLFLKSNSLANLAFQSPILSIGQEEEQQKEQ